MKTVVIDDSLASVAICCAPSTESAASAAVVTQKRPYVKPVVKAFEPCVWGSSGMDSFCGPVYSGTCVPVHSPPGC